MIIKPLKLVITSGSKTWVYRDSRTYKTLGQYPLIDTTTARQAALGMMQGTALPMLPIQPIVLGKQDDTTSGNACEPLATLAQAVAEYVESRKLADTTAKQFTGITRAMSEYAHSPIDQLTPDVFTQWHQEKVKAGRGAMAALNGRYIRALFRWAAVRYDRPDLTDPTIKVRALTGASFNTKAKDTRLTEATLGCWWQLVSACEPLAVRVLLITYLLTGARKSELLELHTRDVSRPDGGRVCLQLNDTKNGTTHRLQLGQWLSQQWDTLLMASPDGLLFAGQAGRLRANVERISEKMGAAGVGLHDLRRSFTSFAHAAGVEMATLKALVNHTPTGGDVTTRHYLRVTPDAMRDAWQRVESYIIANATEKAA
jgi:integrase